MFVITAIGCGKVQWTTTSGKWNLLVRIHQNNVEFLIRSEKILLQIFLKISFKILRKCWKKNRFQETSAQKCFTLNLMNEHSSDKSGNAL